MPTEPDRVRITFQLDVAYCSECPCHQIIPNPDRHDPTSTDHALLCRKLPNENLNLAGSRPSDRTLHRVILDSGRHLDRQPVPAWCPLREPNNVSWTQEHIASVRRSRKLLLPFEILMTELGLGWQRCIRSLEFLPFGEAEHARVVAFLKLLEGALEVFGSKEAIRTWLLRPDRSLGAAPLDACKLRIDDVWALLKTQKGPASEELGLSREAQRVGAKSSPASS